MCCQAFMRSFNMMVQVAHYIMNIFNAVACINTRKCRIYYCACLGFLVCMAKVTQRIKISTSAVGASISAKYNYLNYILKLSSCNHRYLRK